jgi:hypothetical protein
MLKPHRVVQWMNIIRETQGAEQYRILESFWESQVTSKQWILDALSDLNMSCYGSVYIFGGWFGVLGGMLRDTYTNIDVVYSIDVDANTKLIGERLNPDVTFITSDMKDFVFPKLPSLVINTSTEHVSQTTLDAWLERVPKLVPVILQGNNFFSCAEHVRCSNNLDEFKKMNPLGVTKYEGELDCKQFTRYMTIGYKL